MRLPNAPKWKIFVIVLLILAAVFINFWFITHAHSEDMDCWVMCQPDSYVCVRMNPKKRSIEIGRFECGDKLLTDGVIKNGFLHVYATIELGEGWIHKGYIVYNEPHVPIFQDTQVRSNGRVSARKTINGKRRCWVKDGQSIKVYMVSEEWSVTNKGFVKTKFLDLGK